MLLLWLACSKPDQLTLPTASPAVIYLEGGSFDMGVGDVEVGPYGNHWKEISQPQHEVTISSFWLDQLEVTQAEYAAFLNAIELDAEGTAYAHHHPLQPVFWEAGMFKAEKEAHPINYVSYYNALSFCGWRGGMLPTEAQWERAAKGIDRENPRAYPWEEGGPSCQKAIYYTNNVHCADTPQAVGTRPLGATPEGIADLGGNVSEWVYDIYARYEPESQTNPLGASSGKYRILRGGGFHETSDAMRATDRVVANPLSRAEGIGFRCAYAEEPI